MLASAGAVVRVRLAVFEPPFNDPVMTAVSFTGAPVTVAVKVLLF